MVGDRDLSRLVDAMCKNKHLVEVNLGVFDNKGLRYLGRNLDKILTVKHITIQESTMPSPSGMSSDQSLHWERESMEDFVDSLEIARSCPLLSINIISSDLNKCEQFVGSLSVILENRRSLHLLAMESDFLANKVDIETEELEEL